MRGLLRAASSFVLLLGLVACGDKAGGPGAPGGGGPEGSWTLDVDGAVKAQEAEMQARLEKMTPEQRAMAEGMMKSVTQMVRSMVVDVTLKPDHTMTFQVKTVGKDQTGEGTWSMAGDKVTVQATKVNGAPPPPEDKEAILLWQDGRLNFQAGEGHTVPLKRK